MQNGRINQQLHESEVAARYGLSRPQVDSYILHGQSSHPMQLGQLLQLVTQGHGSSGARYCDQNNFFVELHS